MSQPKHTPGPWTFKTDGYGDYEILTVDGIGVAYILEDHHPNCKNNGPLIAAAPCLLTRLESMAAQHACGCGHPACKRCADDQANQEVIAKAKGGAE